MFGQSLSYFKYIISKGSCTKKVVKIMFPYPLAITRLEGPVNFSFGRPVRHIAPLVIKFFTSCKGQFYFHKAMGKIKGQRNQGKAFFLGLTYEFCNFPFMHEQLAVTPRLMVEDIAMVIFTDVKVV